ncbi:MAG: hypothetical protein IT562_16435 [Alphaproteobacteria bacterium]|nr:hypothetical protein [Alphaproteobacteria bacterium]
MVRKLLAAAAILSAIGATGASAQTVRQPESKWSQVSNNCQFGERIDGSTAADARRRIEAAGLTNVRDLRKGCDNVWHATANAGGGDVYVALSPSGEIMRETN